MSSTSERPAAARGAAMTAARPGSHCSTGNCRLRSASPGRWRLIRTTRMSSISERARAWRPSRRRVCSSPPMAAGAGYGSVRAIPQATRATPFSSSTSGSMSFSSTRPTATLFTSHRPAAASGRSTAGSTGAWAPTPLATPALSCWTAPRRQDRAFSMRVSLDAACSARTTAARTGRRS